MAVTSIAEQKFIEVNTAFLDKLGYKREEVIGKTAQELELFIENEKQNTKNNNKILFAFICLFKIYFLYCLTITSATILLDKPVDVCTAKLLMV